MGSAMSQDGNERHHQAGGIELGERGQVHTTAERFAALSRIGVALMSEHDEDHLLQLITRTARDLTGATFAAFTLRPVNEQGLPLVPSEGHLFRLAAVLGVSKEQEELFHRVPLGGEGLLAPIFRHGVPVRVADATRMMYGADELHRPETRAAAHDAAFAFAHGRATPEDLRSLGVPRGHPIIRSFLGAPLLNRDGDVRGGLLLGHAEPDCFTEEDETLLVGLAAQAAVALENARLYRILEIRARELDAIFQSITDGVLLVDQQGQILRENNCAHYLRRRLQQQPEGEQMLNTLLHTPARLALQGKWVEEDVTLSFPTEQNEQHVYIVSASPLRQPSGMLVKGKDAGETEESITGAVVVWNDVTETRRLLLERREHAETEARRAFLQYILDEMPGSVYLVHGHDGRMMIANRAASTFWGAEWPVGMPMFTFLEQQGIRLLTTEGYPLTAEQTATLRALRQGETVRQYQEIIRHRDGTVLPVLVNAIVLDADQVPLALNPTRGDASTEPEPVALVVHQDVTALKEAERIKDEFIGIAAHELRNPLAVLKGFAQMLIVQTARGNGAELADWQVEALQSIDQATVRLVELIDDLLDVTRLQAGRLALHTEPIDLVAFTRRMVTRLQMTTERHCLQLARAPEALVVQVDPQRLEQVLSNLIGNAIKYSPNGGQIEIGLEEDRTHHQALVSVKDEGIGIPQHQQARMFGRFVRGENADAQGIRGTGLGLYLCRELIERLGGRIWFESVEGQGSTFLFVLPLLEDEVV